jgi:hypothetical protein
VSVDFVSVNFVSVNLVSVNMVSRRHEINVRDGNGQILSAIPRDPPVWFLPFVGASHGRTC